MEDDLAARLAVAEDKLMDARFLATALVGIVSALSLRMGVSPQVVGAFAKAAEPGGDAQQAAELAVTITTHLVQMGSRPKGRA